MRSTRYITAAILGACLLAACGEDASETANPAGEETATASEDAARTPGAAARGDAAEPHEASRPAASFIPPADLDTSTWILQPPFYAGGNEPYWRLDTMDGWFVFRRSGLPEIDAPLVQPMAEGDVNVFDTPPLKIVIQREPCQASDTSQADISAKVVFDDVEFSGCAFGGSSQSSSAEATVVVEALGPIDACLAQLAEPALVTAVYPREGERIAVGLRTRQGALFECAVEEDRSTIAFLDPIEPRAASAWMSRMRFLRAGVADTVACDDAEEVRVGDVVAGRLLGKSCRF